MTPLQTRIDRFALDMKDMDRVTSDWSATVFNERWANAPQAWHGAIGFGQFLWTDTPLNRLELEALAGALGPWHLSRMMAAFDVTAVHGKTDIHPGVEAMIAEFVRDTMALDPRIGALITKALLQDDPVGDVGNVGEVGTVGGVGSPSGPATPRPTGD